MRLADVPCHERALGPARPARRLRPEILSLAAGRPLSIPPTAWRRHARGHDLPAVELAHEPLSATLLPDRCVAKEIPSALRETNPAALRATFIFDADAALKNCSLQSRAVFPPGNAAHRQAAQKRDTPTSRSSTDSGTVAVIWAATAACSTFPAIRNRPPRAASSAPRSLPRNPGRACLAVSLPIRTAACTCRSRMYRKPTCPTRAAPRVTCAGYA